MEKRDAIKFIIETLEVRCNMGYSINEILTKEGIEKLLFIENKKNPFNDGIEIDIFNYLRSKRCNMSEICFDNADIFGLDFTGFTGVKINPSYKDLTMCTFAGVEFTGPFDKSVINTTDFTGSKGAIIDVSNLVDNSIVNSKMSDVTFVGTFDNADLYGADFTGSIGAKINPNELGIEELANTTLCDVEFTEPISCSVDGADFTGSKNAVILTDNIDSFRDTILKDAIVIGSFEGKDCTGMNKDGAILLGNLIETKQAKRKSKKRR